MEFDEEALLAQILESVGKKAPTKQLEVVTIQPSERPNPHLGDESNTEIKTVCPRVGEEIFWQLSTSFYKKVYTWEYEPFVAMFQKRCVAFAVAVEDQASFFIELFGGSDLFSQLKGPPAMRLRHSQFRIREEDAAVWLKYMRESLDEVFAAFPVEREIIWKELQSQAEFITNTRKDGSRIYGPLDSLTYIKKISELQKHATKK